jgi:hypothetical protein
MGLPWTSKKEPLTASRKRYRPTGFAVIDDDDDDEEELMTPQMPLFPRQLFPVSVDGLPRPTA